LISILGHRAFPSRHCRPLAPNGAYCAEPESCCICAGLSRTCNTPDLLTAVMSLTFTQVLCAIGFEGPSRRSLFRHASTRPPHGRSLHPPEPRRGIWHTTAHPSRMQEQEKPPCRGLVPRYRRSFARLFPRRHCACRSLRAHETQNITHQRGRPSV
jgi:hypothetical protein